MPGDLFIVFTVMLKRAPLNTTSPREAAKGNVEVFINEASVSAVTVVLAEVVREAFSLGSLALLLSAGFELSISDIVFCYLLETELYLFTLCTL